MTLSPVLAALDELHGTYIVTPIDEGALVAPANGAIVYAGETMSYIIQPLYSDRDREKLRRQMLQIAERLNR